MYLHCAMQNGSRKLHCTGIWLTHYSSKVLQLFRKCRNLPFKISGIQESLRLTRLQGKEVSNELLMTRSSQCAVDDKKFPINCCSPVTLCVFNHSPLPFPLIFGAILHLCIQILMPGLPPCFFKLKGLDFYPLFSHAECPQRCHLIPITAVGVHYRQ